MKVTDLYIGNGDDPEIVCYNKNLPVRAVWDYSVVFKSADFERPMWYSKICFGELIKRNYNMFVSDEHNTGTVYLLVNKKWKSSVIPNVEVRSWSTEKYSVLDNRLNVPLEIVREILDLLKKDISFSYKIQEQDHHYMFTLDFNDVTRTEMLFVLNICRRFWRYLLSAELLAVYELYKSHTYNLSFFELLIIADRFYGWSMSDDLFSPDSIYNTTKRYNFKETHLDLKRLKLYLYKIRDFLDSYCVSENDYDFNENNKKLKTNFKKNIERNIQSKRVSFDSSIQRFDTYVKKITFYLNKYFNLYKENNLI